MRFRFTGGVQEAASNAHAVISDGNMHLTPSWEKLSTDESPPARVVFGIGEQFSRRILDQAENIVFKIHTRQGTSRDFGSDFINVTARKIQGLHWDKTTGGTATNKVFRDFDSKVSQKIDPLEIAQVFTGLHAN